MKSMKKIFIVLLILLTFNLYLPNVAFAEQGPTKHPLEIRSTPAKDIPKIKVKKTSGWTWVIVVGLLGGLLAAASSGGGGDSGGDSSSGGGSDSGDGSGDSDGGDVTGTW